MHRVLEAFLGLRDVRLKGLIDGPSRNSKLCYLHSLTPYWGNIGIKVLKLRDYPPRMENQMEKKMENEMETGGI